ncbi:hypothetical protein KEM09_17135 [Carboxylicivirga mesophila]|uniref:Outer membrane protein beta-barrel domain-containing protein n=1 Tax=Carboxylicivirga mesophila TaxID=1166478 RepID=A0ABS5KDM8_9BACT|nr:hypothetical protein [Carboxylicivirga mesophila]MBS2213144.1 hypothetical protein [Carboxylicivirga mesophila]
MKKLVLMALFAVIATQVDAQNNLSVDWGNTTNYIAHGRTLSANQACFQPGVYYSFNNGPTVMAWFSLPYDRQFHALDEWDIIIDHSVNIYKQEQNWNINLHGYVNYWYLPINEESDKQDYYQGMKYNAGIHFPFMLSKSNGLKLTTGYDFYYYHQLGRDMNIRAAGIHEFLMKFNKSYKKVNLEAKSVISNNQGAVDNRIEPGWGFFSQHLSCSFNIKAISLRTGINYQRTMKALEPTGIDKDLLWFSLNIGKSFKL